MEARPCSLAVAKRFYLEARHVGLSGVRTWFVIVAGRRLGVDDERLQ